MGSLCGFPATAGLLEFAGDCPPYMTKVTYSRIKKRNCDIDESVEEPGRKDAVSGDEAQDMPLTPTQQDIDWQTGISKLKFPSNLSYTKENDELKKLTGQRLT
ncbi:hypothetical protein OUZ56_029661 [Daphnia magna]|uniref:Uncharacterized protein n=1 Tax=Daphnia magna TaxID=35525 RepID=A0ABR0B7G6_9CRUS|nr:hypothetical protein OUZ56_029661 [Daphnia magna]